MNLKIIDENNVAQANWLIEHRPEFTHDELRLFLTIVSLLHKEDDDFEKMIIPVKNFVGLWDLDPDSGYRKMKAALLGLQSKPFVIEGLSEKGKLKFFSVSTLTMASYESGAGYATVKISPEFKPFLLNLKKQYTIYGLHNVLHLRSVNTIRIFELMKQHEYLGSIEYLVTDFKDILNLTDKYKNNADLKRTVLDTAVEDINKNTDIQISYDFQGRGKFARITWKITSKDKIEESEQSLIAAPDDGVGVVPAPSKQRKRKVKTKEILPDYHDAVMSCLSGWSLFDGICTSKDIQSIINICSQALPAPMDQSQLVQYLTNQCEYIKWYHLNQETVFAPLAFLRDACKNNYFGNGSFNNTVKKKNAKSKFETEDRDLSVLEL